MAAATLILLSFGLAMDAIAVSASTGLTLPREGRISGALRLAATFGLFQAVMALLGWIAGAEMIERIGAWDHWVAFALLAGIGGKMLWESFHQDTQSGEGERTLALVPLLILGVATSIDSLAAGVTLPMLGLPMVIAVGTIGLVTAVLSFAAAIAARRLGESIGERLELVGGMVLIGIGLKILIEG